ncbi:PEPxxWA-CTERM sorting domain-containing protein [uncultured Sphingomonas sp.]|uniref:PEPxxWA-CTERM sorting domain-containing protein n=1 Tax=uncultured Sphingomonas sp. TaxID=158754 RepID=UPI0035CA3943
MKLMLSATALAVALSFASAAHAGPAGGPPPGGPVDPGDPGDEPDYYSDPAAGISGDGSGTTGTGVSAVPITPIGTTNFATPGYGTIAGLGGAVQGGFPGQSTSLVSVGQVFNSTGGTLNQLSFVDTNSAAGGEQLKIAVFNPVGFTADNLFTNPGAIGPVVYSSTVNGLLTNFGDGGGVNGNDALFYHTFSNINLSLTAGLSYYAYLTPTAGSQVFNGSNSGYASRAYFFELATKTSSLGGEFLAGTSDGSFFRVANQAPNTAPFLQAFYNISITPSATGAVPEPASWAMMIGGFGLAGAAMRRRRTVIAFG